MIEVRNVVKVYKNGRMANDHVHLTIEKGGILGLIGPNGAGKTTLVRQIVGLSKPTSGEIVVGELKPSVRREELAKKISFYNQKAVLLEAHTAFEVISFTGIYRGQSKEDAANQACVLMDYFGIRSEEKKRLAHLSGGQIKLVMLAAAFMGNCPVIVLDEPTNDLDPINRSRLWKLVKQVNEEEGITFLIVSHNLSELETIARSVAIMKDGKVVDQGDIQQIKSRYNAKYRISIKCPFQWLNEVIHEVARDYLLENQNEIVLEADKEEVSEILSSILPVLEAYHAEIKIYRQTLSSIYQILMEESSHA